MNPGTLEAIARGAGGRAFRITPSDTSLSALASAIEGMEQRSLAREYAYRKKERFQVPLGVAFACLLAALGLPLPTRRSGKGAGQTAVKAASLLVAALAFGSEARAAGVADEVLLRPKRLTSSGRAQYEQGNHPESLKSFEGAAGLRPDYPRAKFNLADALYKSGKFEEAAALFRALGADVRSPLAAPARFNLGNALFQKQDFPEAVRAYRDALEAAPGDAETRRNLEMALRALQQQKEQQQKQDQKNKDGDKDKDKQPQASSSPTPGGTPPQNGQRPKTEPEKEQERFQQEAGMPRERAMQLLDALQQNEKDEQKKLLAAKQAQRKGGKDW